MKGETTPPPHKRLTLAELLDALPTEARPAIVWGQIVSKLPESFAELQDELAAGIMSSPTDQEFSGEFLVLIASSEDPDTIVRQLPYSEGMVDGKPTLWVHFILPPLND